MRYLLPCLFYQRLFRSIAADKQGGIAMNRIVVKPVMTRTQWHGIEVTGPSSRSGTTALMMNFGRGTGQSILTTGNATELCDSLQIISLFTGHRLLSNP